MSDVPAIQAYWDLPGFDTHIHLRFRTARAAWDAYDEECRVMRIRYYFVVEKEGAVIGAVRLDQLTHDPKGLNLHLEMSPAHSGQGYMTEAAQAVIEWAHNRIDFTYIQATAHPENLPSQRVLDKLGFKFIETRKNYIRRHAGDLQDRIIYQLFKRP